MALGSGAIGQTLAAPPVEAAQNIVVQGVGDPFHSAHYYIGATEVGLIDQKIPDGTAIRDAALYGLTSEEPEPDIFTWPAGAKSFAGWFTTAADAAAAADSPAYDTNRFDFNSTAPINDDIYLYAAFYYDYLVGFLSHAGDVIQSNLVASGGALPTFTNHHLLGTPQGQILDSWYTNAALTAPATGPVNSDLTLYPKFVGVQYVIFDSQGGSLVDFAPTKTGQTLDALPTPTKTGYILDGWSTTSACTAGTMWDVDDPVNSDFTLYACWSPDPDARADVKVIFWFEKPNQGVAAVPLNTDYYDFAKTVTLTNRPVGEAIETTVAAIPASGTGGHPSLNSATADLKGADPWNPTDWTANSATVLGDGNTIINVFYKRTVYTIIFNLNGGSLTDNATSVTYTGTQYVLQAKVGQNIAAEFPISDSGRMTLTGSGSTPYFTQFDTFSPALRGSGETSWISSRPIFSWDMTPTSGTTITTRAAWTASNHTVYFHEMKEQLLGDTSTPTAFRGKDFVEDTNLSALRYFTYSSHYGKPIEGFTIGDNDYQALNSVGAPATGGNVTQYYRYYSRVRGTLTFDASGGQATFQDATVTLLGVYGVSLLANPNAYSGAYGNIMFEQPLSWLDVANNVTPELDNDDYYFGGWYWDPDFGRPVNWATDTMPAGDTTVYAQWLLNPHNVWFYPSVEAADDNPFAGSPQSVPDGAVPTSVPALSNDTQVYLDGTGHYVIATVDDPDNWHLGEFTSWVTPLTVQGLTAYVPYDPATVAVYRDIKVYATYKTEGIEVSFEPGAGTWTDTSTTETRTETTTFTIGTDTRLWLRQTVAAPAGQVFLGWQRDGSGRLYYPGQIYRVTGTTHFVALYLPLDDAVMLRYHANDVPGVTRSDSVAAYPLSVQKNASAHLLRVEGAFGLDFERPGFDFVGWSETRLDDLAWDDPTPAGVTAPGDSISIGTVDVDLYGVWRQAVYTVTYAPGLHGSWLATATGYLFEHVAYGADTPAVSGSLPHDAGWQFTGWAPAVAATVTQDVVYIAQWERAYYAVTYAPGDHGTWATTDPSGAPAAQATGVYYFSGLVHGAWTPAAPTDTPHEDGWTFVGWAPVRSQTVTESTVYVAQWERVPGQRSSTPPATTTPPASQSPSPSPSPQSTDDPSPTLAPSPSPSVAGPTVQNTAGGTPNPQGSGATASIKPTPVAAVPGQTLEVTGTVGAGVALVLAGFCLAVGAAMVLAAGRRQEARHRA
jgi:uncharacterized repeat protein (TIGR02543 family)